MFDAMSVALGASDGRSDGAWAAMAVASSSLVTAPSPSASASANIEAARSPGWSVCWVLSSEANVSVLKPWPDEDQPCIGGGGPFLPPDGRFCPTWANGRRRRVGARRLGRGWSPSPAAAAATAMSDPTLEMVICLSFEEGAPVLRRTPAPKARRGERVRKTCLISSLLRLDTVTSAIDTPRGIGKLRLDGARDHLAPPRTRKAPLPETRARLTPI
jgi:hypothetical protein